MRDLGFWDQHGPQGHGNPPEGPASMAKVEVWVTLPGVSDHPLLSHSTYKYSWWPSPWARCLRPGASLGEHSGLRGRGKRPLTLKPED